MTPRVKEREVEGRYDMFGAEEEANSDFAGEGLLAVGPAPLVYLAVVVREVEIAHEVQVGRRREQMTVG